MYWRNISFLKTAALTAASLLFAAGPASAQHRGGGHGGAGHGGHHGGHGGGGHGGGYGHGGYYRGGYGGHYGYHRHGYYPGFNGLGVGIGLGYAYPYSSYGYDSYPSYVGGYYRDLGPVDGSYVAAPVATQDRWRQEGYRRVSPDRPEDLVRSWYRTYLNREPDPLWAVWVDAVRNGQEPNSVLASILSSQEYYDKSGGTPEGFVQTLFRDVTGRRPTPREMDYWVQRTHDRNRTDVAYAILTR